MVSRGIHVQIRLAIARFEALFDAVFFPDEDVVAELSAKNLSAGPVFTVKRRRGPPTPLISNTSVPFFFAPASRYECQFHTLEPDAYCCQRRSLSSTSQPMSGSMCSRSRRQVLQCLVQLCLVTSLAKNMVLMSSVSKSGCRYTKGL